MSPLMRLISRRIRVISSSGGGVGAGPVVHPVDGGGQSFAGAQQIVEVCLQVGQERDVGAEVVAAGAAEPDRRAPPALTLVGSVQVPRTATSPMAWRARSESIRARVIDPVAVPVEAERGDRDGVAAAPFSMR